MSRPKQDVVDAIENGTSSITRRIDFYESDNETEWYPDGEDLPRLVDGSVTVDYNRDERRALDITLDNVDNALRPDPQGGLWYDKIIKTFRGVRYAADPSPPRIAIVEEDTPLAAWEMHGILTSLGFYRTEVKVAASSFADVADYDILVSYMRESKTAKTGMLNVAFQNGKKIITVGSRNDPDSVPLLITDGVSEVLQTYAIEPVPHDTPLNGGWLAETVGVFTGFRPTIYSAGSVLVATRGAGFDFPMAIIREDSSGGRWFHYQPPEFLTQGKILLKKAVTWLHNYQPYQTWETQVGEFVIDNIAESNYPHLTKVTGRDFTKKMLNSKAEKDFSFAAGTPLVQFIQAIATNAGIKKFRLPNITTTLQSRIDAERGTERWNIIKKAAESNGFELYIDAQGYLTMRQFIDPVYGALDWTFQTGAQGNLVSWDRSANDSRIYNHIIVTGEQPGVDGGLPYFGEARNDEPSSPTRIERIGDRAYFYTSQFFTNDQQCIDLANRWLKIKALESYEISWTSLHYPWMEVGSIVEFLDPRRTVDEPTRFLLDTLSLPMGLGPMSATGKRVTVISDSELADQITPEDVLA